MSYLKNTNYLITINNNIAFERWEIFAKLMTHYDSLRRAHEQFLRFKKFTL